MARSHGKFQALGALVFPEKGALTVYLSLVKQALQVGEQLFSAAVNRIRNKDGSQGTLYLVSTRLPDGDTSLDYKQITPIYQRSGRPLPWNVEGYHKSLKKTASTGKSPTKTPDT